MGDGGGDVRLWGGEARDEPGVATDEVVEDGDLAIAGATAGADADGDDGAGSGDGSSNGVAGALYYNREGTGAHNGVHVLHDGGGFFICFAVHAVAAFFFHLLGEEADVPLDGDAGLNNGADVGFFSGTALKLNGMGAHGDECAGGLQGLLGGVVGVDGHVCHDEGIFGGASHGCGVVQHVV